MGQSLSWIAAQGLTKQEFQKKLGFRSTGKYGNYGEHSILGRELQNGWYILIINACDDKITKAKMLTQLSENCQIVCCEIEEHVMFSSSSFWERGKKKWAVKHRGEKDVFDLEKSGKLPSNYAALKDELLERQKSEEGEAAGVDYIFELPLKLADQIVGFKHDEKDALIEDAYEVYEFNYFQRLSRFVSGAFLWLSCAGVLVTAIVISVGIGMIFRKLLDWLIQFAK